MYVSTVVVSMLLAQVSGLSAVPVRVCVEPDSVPFYVVTHSEAVAAQMFAEIGVKIEWLRTRRDCQARPEDSILIRLSRETPADRFPGSLAYALPYEGAHIEVFYDRIIRMTEPRSQPALLAHVLVHEVGHILEGVSRHSTNGVMKAHWDQHDYMDMTWKPLPFAQEDVLLIHLGLNARAPHLASTRPPRLP